MTLNELERRTATPDDIYRACRFPPEVSVVRRTGLRLSNFVSVRDSHDLVGILRHPGRCFGPVPKPREPNRRVCCLEA